MALRDQAWWDGSRRDLERASALSTSLLDSTRLACGAVAGSGQLHSSREVLSVLGKHDDAVDLAEEQPIVLQGVDEPSKSEQDLTRDGQIREILD